MRTDADHWLRFFAGLAAWRKLPTSAREALLLLQPSRLRSGAPSAAVRLADKGWLESGPDGKDRVPLGRAAMYHLIATLGGVDPFAGADDSPALLGRYLKQHFEPTDLTPICSGSWGGWDVPTVAKKVCTQAWIDSFLNGQAPRWEARLGGWLRRHYFSSPNIMGCAQRMLSRAKASPGPLPLSDLLDAGRADKLETAFKALTGLLRYLLVFAGLHPDTLEPQIGLWPELTARLHRPPAGLPATVEPVEVFHQPHLADDLAVLLTTAASAPLRLKANGCDLFAKDAAEMTAAFPPLPAWLAGSPADRLRELLFELKRHDPERVSYYDDGLELVPGQIRFGVQDPDDFDHLPWLDSIWREAPSDGCVAVNAFLDYHARVSHPLANPVVPDAFRPHLAFRYGSSRFVLREENVEEFARELLARFFWDRLVPLGCVEAHDRETALRVQRLLGERSALLNDTLIEWRGAQLGPALRKKLSDQGLFLETP